MIDEPSDLSFSKPYLLTMAKTVYAGHHETNSHFMITLRSTPWLDKRYNVFGEILDGFDTV